MADTVDPLAGSYYVEQLTDEIERRALAYIERIDALGGARKAIEAGYIQNEIQDAAYAALRAVESGEQVVVGVNKFQHDSRDALPADLLRIDEAVQAEQIARLRAVRASRDAVKVADALARIQAAAQDPSAALMPLFVEAVSVYATLGEICNTLRGVFGEYRTMKKQPTTRMCFVCGESNPAGVHVRFYEQDDGSLLARFTPQDQHQGYPGRMHGGVITAVMDECVGRAIMIKYGEAIWGVTAELNVRFRKPVPLEVELTVRGPDHERRQPPFRGHRRAVSARRHRCG